MAAVVFNTELNYIKNDRIRSSVEVLISKIPDYFYKEAASSTGKYHPAFSQGEGGLLRHTKAAVKIANTLLNNDTIGYKFTKDEKDLIILALIMHDTVKRGIHEERYTKLLNNIAKGITFSSDGDAIWICRNCGHVVIGKNAPDVCPVCNHPKSFFEKKANNY